MVRNSANGWTRSPNVTNTNNALIVNTDGSLNNNNTYNSNGVRPDLRKQPEQVTQKRESSAP